MLGFEDKYNHPSMLSNKLNQSNNFANPIIESKNEFLGADDENILVHDSAECEKSDAIGPSSSQKKSKENYLRLPDRKNTESESGLEDYILKSPKAGSTRMKSGKELHEKAGGNDKRHSSILVSVGSKLRQQKIDSIKSNPVQEVQNKKKV